LRERAGYDQVLQAMTGMCCFQGTESEPQIVYGSVVDYYAASMVAYGVAAALLHRERSGEGQCVGVSLLRSALAMQSARFVWAESEGRDVGRDMRSGGITGLHPTKEGFLYLSANTPHFWSSLCELIGLPELASNDRYATVRKRAEHAGEIVPKVRVALTARTALEWEEVFGDRVPCSAARSIEDMFEHPQVRAEKLVTEFDHPLVGRYRGFSKPVTFSSTPGPQPFARPRRSVSTPIKSSGTSDTPTKTSSSCGAAVPSDLTTIRTRATSMPEKGHGSATARASAAVLCATKASNESLQPKREGVEALLGAC
jgi:formyl-CoA transferase